MSLQNIDLANEPGFVRTEKSKGKYHNLSKTAAKVRKVLELFGTAIGGIFFIPALSGGLILWLVLANDLRTALFALLGLALSFSIAHLLSLDDNRLNLSRITSNGLLTSIAVSWLTLNADQPLHVELVILFLTITMASLGAAASIRAFRHTPLPPLSISYCFIIGLTFTLLPEWANSATKTMTQFVAMDSFADVVLNFLRSLGNVFFSPYPFLGLMILIALLSWSPTMTIVGLMGWISGTITASTMQNMGIEFHYLIAAHNYFFAAILTSTVLILPGRWTFLIAAISGANAAFLSAGIQIMFDGTAFAYLPLPAILTTWMMLGALTFAIDKDILHLNLDPKRPPEEVWWRARYWADRAGYPEPLVGVPISGEVEIVQGFDGKFTHKGLWRHAIDFQRPAISLDASEMQKSTWGTPVYAPMSGIVEIANFNVVDNQFGTANFAENWGNYIVIRLDKGGYLLMAHFRQDSITVGRGFRVSAGDYLGEIGNSGRSPYPHLHMQVQKKPEPGTPTSPFRLANYLTRQQDHPNEFRWNASGLPKEGSLVQAAPRNPAVFSILSSISPGKAIWHREIKGDIPFAYKTVANRSIEKMDLALDQSGQLIFKGLGQDHLILNIDFDALRVVENNTSGNALLKFLSLNCMAIPHAAKQNMIWSEPALLVPSKPQGIWELMSAPYKDRNYTLINHKCLSAPDSYKNNIVIQTTFEGKASHLPLKITGTYELLRGPISLVVEYENGEIKYNLQSFEPSYITH